MLLFQAYKLNLFKIENGKIIRTEPPAPQPTDDKRMVKFREDMQRYEELQRKAAVCKCPKGTHEQKQVEKVTVGEPG